MQEYLLYYNKVRKVRFKIKYLFILQSMDSLQMSLIFTVAFATIATALNWSELEPLQRVLYPLWIFGLCLPNF